MARFDVPDEGYVWLTTEARRALEAIPNPQQRKKRDTVVLLACQAAGMLLDQKGRPLSMHRTFEDARVCSEGIWYGKWQYIPEVAQALELCTRSAQEYADKQTALIEALAHRRLREGLAEAVATPVEALLAIEADAAGPTRERLEAIRMHIGAVAPEYAARMQPSKATALPVDVQNPVTVAFGDVTADELGSIEAALRREAGGGGAT